MKDAIDLAALAMQQKIDRQIMNGLSEVRKMRDTDPRRRQVGGDHYAKHEIQPWDIIEEYDLNFWEGNALKYLLRRKSNRLEDLQKAQHYLEHEIDRHRRAMAQMEMVDCTFDDTCVYQGDMPIND